MLKNNKIQILSILSLMFFIGYQGYGQRTAQNTNSKRDLAYDNINLVEPTDAYPVSMGITGYPQKIISGQEIELIVKVKIHHGWHIYASVPDSGFYTETEIELDVPEGLNKVGELSIPSMETYLDDPEVMLYVGELQFSQKLVCDKEFSGEATVNFSISYTACDMYMCKAPERLEKSFVFKIGKE